tara:strand:+ start:149 stop:418 length:270 start_codon:yes stop_codon:yes gene_type:complete
MKKVLLCLVIALMMTGSGYAKYGSDSQCNLLETLMSLHYENMNFYSNKFLKHSGNDSKFRSKYMSYAEEYIQHVKLLKDTSDIYNNICD